MIRKVGEDKRPMLSEEGFEKLLEDVKRNKRWIVGEIFGKYKLSEKQIDRFMEKGVPFLDKLYLNQILNKRQVDKALEIGEELWSLYKNIDIPMTEEQIDRAMEIGKDLGYLYEYRKLNSRQVDKALEIRKGLWVLYKNTDIPMTEKQIDRAIEIGEHLSSLYRNRKLNSRQVDKVLEMGRELWSLYESTNIPMTEEQIDRAIEIGKDLNILYRNRKLNSKQVDKALEIGEGLWGLYENTDIPMTEKQIDRAIEIGGEGLSYLYRYRDLSEEQVKKAVELDRDLDKLCESKNITTKEQVDMLADKDRGEKYLELLYRNSRISEEIREYARELLNLKKEEFLKRKKKYKGIVEHKETVSEFRDFLVRLRKYMVENS